MLQDETVGNALQLVGCRVERHRTAAVWRRGGGLLEGRP